MPKMFCPVWTEIPIRDRVFPLYPVCPYTALPGGIVALHTPSSCTAGSPRR
jgi:hypothetical protein